MTLEMLHAAMWDALTERIYSSVLLETTGNDNYRRHKQDSKLEARSGTDVAPESEPVAWDSRLKATMGYIYIYII